MYKLVETLVIGRYTIWTYEMLAHLKRSSVNVTHDGK